MNNNHFKPRAANYSVVSNLWALKKSLLNLNNSTLFCYALRSDLQVRKLILNQWLSELWPKVVQKTIKVSVLNRFFRLLNLPNLSLDHDIVYFSCPTSDMANLIATMPETHLMPVKIIAYGSLMNINVFHKLTSLTNNYKNFILRNLFKTQTFFIKTNYVNACTTLSKDLS